MEISAKYIYTVYKEKSFSAAAKVLFLSQPALSTAVSKHEHELGFRIFDRTTVPLSLTPQGKIYIESLEEIMVIENDVSRRIKEMAGATYGTIAIGGSSSASHRILSVICGEFHKKYPNIRIRLDMGGGNSAGDNLLEKLSKHTLDVVMSYFSGNPQFVAEYICDDRFWIVMHKDAPGAKEIAKYSLSRDRVLSSEKLTDDERVDVSIFSGIPFVAYRRKSMTTQQMREILGDFKTAPFEIVNTKNADMHYHLMRHGVGAVMIPEIMAKNEAHASDELLYFLPRSPYIKRSIYLLRNADAPENPIADKFIEVAKQTFAPGKAELLRDNV